MTRTRRVSILQFVFLIMMYTAGASYAQPVPTEVPQIVVAPGAAPRAPQIIELEFTGPEEGFPPRPRDMTNVQSVPWTPIPGRLTPEIENELLRAALRRQQVRRALGARYAYLGASEIDPPKGQSTPGELQVLLSFYSYSANVAVDVRMRGGRVVEVIPRPGYQPAESSEEVERAVRLAQQDPRLGENVRGLEANGIVIGGPPGTDHFRNRIIYVTFGPEDYIVPSHFAAVDLTTDRVLEAGRLPD